MGLTESTHFKGFKFCPYIKCIFFAQRKYIKYDFLRNRLFYGVGWGFTKIDIKRSGEDFMNNLNTRKFSGTNTILE